MGIHRKLSRFALATMVLFAALTEILKKPVDHSAALPGEAVPRKPTIKVVLLTVFASLVVLMLGAGLLMVSGFYNIAADLPHVEPVRWMLQAGRTRSVEFHSRGIQAPDLNNPALARDGFVFYRKLCQPCHGGPGIANEQIGRGINPKPPPLMTATANWTDPQLYWIISHGLKMSGMPGFAPPLSEGDRWAIVAFVRRLAVLSPGDYEFMVASADPGADGAIEDLGFGWIKTGRRESGRALVQKYGCTTCHVIPEGGSGLVGPPLTAFAERQYIAGSLVNTPANVVAFIMDPEKLKPHTAMPNLGVRRREAIDIAAYLYTFGSPKRLIALQQASTFRGQPRQAYLRDAK